MKRLVLFIVALVFVFSTAAMAASDAEERAAVKAENAEVKADAKVDKAEVKAEKEAADKVEHAN